MGVDVFSLDAGNYDPKVAVAILAERMKLNGDRIDKLEHRSDALERELGQLQALSGGIKLIEAGQTDIKAVISGLSVTIAAHGQKIDRAEEQDRTERERGVKKRERDAARTNKAINLILGIVTALFTAGGFATFSYLNTTYKSVVIDAGAIIFAAVIAGILLRMIRSASDEEI